MASLGQFLAPGLYRKPEDQPWFVQMLLDAQSKRVDRNAGQQGGSAVAQPPMPTSMPQSMGAPMAAVQPQNFSRDMGLGMAPPMQAPMPAPMAAPRAPAPMGGGLGQPRMPAPAPQAINVPEPVMQAPSMAMPTQAPQFNKPQSMFAKLGGGLAERLLPASQLKALGMDDAQVGEAQTAALRRFGLGMLSNIGTGESFGAGLGKAIEMAGPDQLRTQVGILEQQARKQERDQAVEARKQDVAYRAQRASQSDAQFEAELKQRATLAQQRIDADLKELQIRSAMTLRQGRQMNPLEQKKLELLTRDRERMGALLKKDELTENDLYELNMLTGGAVGDYKSATRSVGGLGGFDFSGGAAGAPAPVPDNGGFKVVGVR